MRYGIDLPHPSARGCPSSDFRYSFERKEKTAALNCTEIMARGLLILLAATICKLAEILNRFVLNLLGVRVETAVFLKPNLNNVIVNVPVMLECYTHENIYSILSFTFSSKGVGASLSSVTAIPGGGIRRSVTFTITAALNGTRVSCYGSTPSVHNRSQQVTTIFARGAFDDFRTCELPNHLFFNWTSAFTLNGFVIQYNITDNLQNKTIYVPHYSVPLRLGYRANITVIVTTAACQAVHGGTKEISDGM